VEEALQQLLKSIYNFLQRHQRLMVLAVPATAREAARIDPSGADAPRHKSEPDTRSDACSFDETPFMSVERKKRRCRTLCSSDAWEDVTGKRSSGKEERAS
jgi:hypothetical protein